MIKSFRQMRKSLPIENLPNGQAGKRLKYSEYGIGELIIVVIGILTAFQKYRKSVKLQPYKTQH